MNKLLLITFAAVVLAQAQALLFAQAGAEGACNRPAAGSVVPEPADLRSQNGELIVDLIVHSYAEPNGSIRECYVDQYGNQAPTLRLKPGDLLVLRLKNDITVVDTKQTNNPMATQQPMKVSMDPAACGSSFMTATSTNLHFHGLTVPPVCHQDDVVKTSVNPGDPPFEYRFHIPENQPPGLYWYHPHIHGFTTPQVLGGASGAMIVEGIERANKQVAGLPERVLVIRDEDLINPKAPPSKSEPVLPKVLIDRDGDAANNGTGFGKPAKDFSINFVPVPYPAYPPAAMSMKPGEQQLFRVLNASAITYLNLAVLLNRVPQPLGLVALDGVPLNESRKIGDFVDWQTHLGVPPGARVEFILKGPPSGEKALFVTRTVDNGPGGENDPNRILTTIAASDDAPEPRSRMDASARPLPAPAVPWLGDVAPVRIRKLYFSEKLADPRDPTSAVEFYLTVDGQKPQMFDPASGIPNIVAKLGTVEDWIIENRTNELHAFHIHQLHFMLLDYLGAPVNEPFLRDTVNVPGGMSHG